MLDKNISRELNKISYKDLGNEFLFPIDKYLLYLERLSLNPYDFLKKWSETERLFFSDKYWKKNIRLDWKWSLSFPLFSVLEKYVDNFRSPKIIGFSGLPGSGKSFLGSWINGVAKEINLDVKVISLDDFYLPGKEMDVVMKGNPWNVPRGFPGSHSIEVLNNSIDTFLNTGVLKSPTFDKSLRNGKGDRSGWCELKPKILILEGWFVGCEPVLNLMEIDSIMDSKYNLCLSQIEKEYRNSIQIALVDYSKLWEKFDKIWHLKSSKFTNTIQWKIQQENEMIKSKGHGLKDKRLMDFIRMIQTCIPQESFLSINSDTTIEINQNRRIYNLYTNKYIF
tara:strand:- start:141 stop:1151 length:1011 start_codon:yes stop_codon:yes gene_type:complete